MFRYSSQSPVAALSGYSDHMRNSILRHGTLLLISIVLAIATGCSRTHRRISGPLPQRGYLWQRAWTPAVIDSITEAQQRMAGPVILGGEIIWGQKEPQFTRPPINWATLARQHSSYGIALR